MPIGHLYALEMSNPYTSGRLCAANNLVRAGHVLLIPGYLF